VSNGLDSKESEDSEDSEEMNLVMLIEDELF
jgi:hypothetical protein